MHLEPTLWRFTQGVRDRIFLAMLVGLVAAGIGIARLALLGWLIGPRLRRRLAFRSDRADSRDRRVMVLRGIFEHWRTMIAHRTAAQVQKHLRRTLFDRIAALGPSYAAQQAVRRPHPFAG